jgi:transketolase
VEELGQNMNNLMLSEINNEKRSATRDGFGRAMLELAEKNPKVVAVCADLTESNRLTEFAQKYPERFIEAGVAEQNMVGMSAGLALGGKIPFAVSFAVFSPGRTWDQIRVSICLSALNVKIVGGHTGLGVGEDGASHQALEDVAIMRVLPNMNIVVPCDANQAHLATLAIAQVEGPVYLRLNRQKSIEVTTMMTPFVFGKAQVLKRGKDLTVVVCGVLTADALMAANELDPNLDIEVINMHTIKPLDEETLLASARKTGRVLVVEDHQSVGGLYGAVSETLCASHPVICMSVGMKDSFGGSGRSEDLYAKYHMDKTAIMDAIWQLMKTK